MTDPVRGASGVGRVAPGAAEKQRSNGGVRAVDNVPISGSDEADVARAEEVLESIAALASAVPAVDQPKVDAIKAAVEAGRYTSDPKVIAQRLVEIEGLLLGE